MYRTSGLRKNSAAAMASPRVAGPPAAQLADDQQGRHEVGGHDRQLAEDGERHTGVHRQPLHGQLDVEEEREVRVRAAAVRGVVRVDVDAVERRARGEVPDREVGSVGDRHQHRAHHHADGQHADERARMAHTAGRPRTASPHAHPGAMYR